MKQLLATMVSVLLFRQSGVPALPCLHGFGFSGVSAFFWLIYTEDVYNASLKDSRFCIAFWFCNGCSLVSLWLCLCMCKQETNLFSQFQFSGIEG